jgi:hypothetical protein
MDCPLGLTDAVAVDVHECPPFIGMTGRGGVFASLCAALRLGCFLVVIAMACTQWVTAVSYGCLGHEFHFGCPSRPDRYESTDR